MTPAHTANNLPSSVITSSSLDGSPPHDQGPDVERLGDAIAELASRITAATYELLVLIRQFDETTGWGHGFASCAHWLNWRTGLDLGAAREKVRVARALADLPVISDAMRTGVLSYAKVRALTRVATPATEASLVGFARCGTAAHVERLVRAWRRMDRVTDEEPRRHAARHLETWVDDDGMVGIRGRLTSEVGAVVRRALGAASAQLAEALPADDRTEMAVGQRRADALGRVAESALANGLDPGTAGDRYQVVVHVDANTLTSDGPAGPATPRGPETVTGQAALDEPEGLHVSAETSRRLSCDSARVTMQHAADGTVLDVGRKTRTISPALRRALTARDRRCRFPGCSSIRCDAHHVTHWAEGGMTRLDNLVLLCRRHHRAVHEEGVGVQLTPDGTACFTQPDGRPILEAPPPPVWSGLPLTPTLDRLRAQGVTVGPHTATPHWHGERLDLPWAIDVLWRPRIGTIGTTDPPAARRRTGQAVLDEPEGLHVSAETSPPATSLSATPP